MEAQTRIEGEEVEGSYQVPGEGKSTGVSVGWKQNVRQREAEAVSRNLGKIHQMRIVCY